MKKIFLLIVAFGCMAAQAQTEEIDAISATQGESTDWYRFADYDDVVEVSITAQGIQFPGDPGKTYAIADGAVFTAFGTAPEEKITLTATDFSVTEDGDWTYDNTEKKVKVEIRADYEMPESSCMTIYYNNDPQVKPINAGTYQVYIDIKGDSRYNDVEGLTSDDWKFTIIAPIQVSYIDENGEAKTVDAWEVTSAAGQVTWNKSWYVVNGEDVQLSKGAICNGAVNLILADGATLTAKGDTYQAGITVSGNGNSLTIYGQTNQSGQLIANGGNSGAGIGGGNEADGSNITINGGVVIATGYTGAAGIGGGENGSAEYITINGGIVTANGNGTAAGIGGGYYGSCSYININGGTVKANGGLYYGVGIGSGYSGGSASNIFVATTLAIKADGNITPTTPIENDGGDLASNLAGKHYATIEPKGTLTADDFVVSNNSATYDGEAKTATVAFKDDITGAGQITVTYKQNSEEVTPKNVGEYDIYVSVTESANYKAFESTKLGTLTIAKATLTASDFTYLAPEDLIWDGNEKTATVMFKSQDKLTGCGEITVKYQKDAVETSPVDAGDYTVSIDVAEGDNYASATGLTDASWKFTIKAPVTFTLPGKKANQYATICLPQPIASVTNGTLYKISYGNVYEVHFVEETNFAADPAGTPYLVQANEDGDIVFTMTDAEPVTEPVGVEAAKGFVASLQEEMQDILEGYDHLLVSGGELHSAGPGCKLSKNHAYIDVNYVPETEPVVPGAPRRVTLYNAEAQSPTGLGQSAITNHKSAMKVVKDGRFMIIRDNMEYNAQGQIIK